MKKQVLLITALLAFVSGFAQSFKLKSHAGVSDAYNFVGVNQKIQFSPAAAKTIFGLNASSNLVLAKTEADKLGFIHYRFYQSYNNIPVDKSMFVVHTKNGILYSTNGTVVTEFADVTDKAHASVSADRAVSIAIANVAAKLYAWQDAGMQQRRKDQTNNVKATYYPKAELVFYNPQETLQSRELRLCYKVDVYALQPLSRADYFIDAQTGKLLGKKDKIYYSDATGTANTAWSGTQTIHSDKTGTNAYRLRDLTKGNGVITLHGESGKRGTDYTSTSANWNLTGFDQAAMDAHFGVEQTYNYYFQTFGRNSYDNQGTALYSYVNDPTYLDNAFWDGSAMNFNKRSNGDPGGVTGIDVTGHELTHGVTQETCGLDYFNESGAINESLSDIMGKSVQFFAKPTDINWLLSNDMNWIIRDMSNPNAEGQPDTYKGTLWYTGGGDNGGVHYNSGVGNFMFYLLVTGGTGTNDKGNSYKVKGVGLAKADQIIYRSQTVYLTQTSQYADWRIACINAATDLYGGTSTETNNVKNAFYAVGIGSDSSGCDAPAGLTVTNITKKSATLQWSAAGVSVGYNLQWKLSTSNNWTTVSNLTTTSYNLTGLIPGFSYDFRVQTKCTATTASAYSAPYTFTTLTNGGGIYCESYGQSTSFEYIDRVAIGNKGYTSGNNNGYGNFLSAGGTLATGKPDTLVLTPGFTGSSYQEYWTAYIDYNQDGDFADAKERIGTATSTGVAKIGFVIPAQALNGLTRMRIQMSYGSQVTDPCGVFSYGEVEDYSVIIKGGTFNAVAANTGRSTGILIMPNPIKTNTATASLNLNNTGDVNIKITDLSGRLLINHNIPGTQIGKNTIVLNNLKTLNNGVFMLIAEQNGVIVGRTQLVVNR
ncbi:MAG: M4 family metallopeptidase [Parafilimonas sp.]|nr:M4 family metallopeptidase [Parafilimonas sp.]